MQRVGLKRCARGHARIVGAGAADRTVLVARTSGAKIVATVAGLFLMREHATGARSPRAVRAAGLRSIATRAHRTASRRPRKTRLHRARFARTSFVDLTV